MPAYAYTWSYLDLIGSITSPVGSFALTNAGSSEDGSIKISFVGDKNVMQIGADGFPMHSLQATKGAMISLSYLKTSPINQKLNKLFNLQTVSSALHGQNVITFQNPVSGDAITGTFCAFKKHPDVDYDAKGASLVWAFDVGILDVSLGGGLLTNLLTLGAGAIT